MMKNSTLVSLTIVVVIGIFILLFLNFFPKIHFSGAPPPSSSIPIEGVRGSSVVHDGVPFTLSYEEQQLAVQTIARAVKVKKTDSPPPPPFTFDKMIFYLFNGPDLEIIPVQFINQSLIFSIPQLDPKMYFMELSGGQLLQMINHSFDEI